MVQMFLVSLWYLAIMFYIPQIFLLTFRLSIFFVCLLLKRTTWLSKQTEKDKWKYSDLMEIKRTCSYVVYFDRFKPFLFIPRDSTQLSDFTQHPRFLFWESTYPSIPKLDSIHRCRVILLMKWPLYTQATMAGFLK